MYTRPPDLGDRDVLGAVRTGWGFDAVTARYAPVGFGSHHWVVADAGGSRRFVTVDELSKRRAGTSPDAVFGRLQQAFETARALRTGGLEFVVAPLPGLDGRVLRALGESFTAAVFPFVEGRPSAYGEYRSDRERAAVGALLRRLHGSTATVAGIAGREDFVLPCRPELDAARAATGRRWTAGPFAERARLLLERVEPDLAAALDLYDELVGEVRADPTAWVVTHGEPHPENVMWTGDGPRLIDWDTALVAPAGRDLWMLEPPGSVPARGGDPATVLYRLWWDLAEIAQYVAEFRASHDATADMAESWRNLEHFARLDERWGTLLRRRR